MPEAVLAAATELRNALIGVDPGLLSSADCAVLAEALAVTEKACAAVRARAAARAIDAGAHTQRGFADGVSWMAHHTGTTSGAAREAIGTAAAVQASPEAEQGLAAGDLSLAQAAEIVRTEADLPGSAAELVEVAKASGVTALRDRARDLRLAAEDPAALHDRQHRARRLRHWRDWEGMICFTGALAPDVGVPLVNRIEIETDRIRRRARSEGSTDGREAHAADALVQMLAGSRGG